MANPLKLLKLKPVSFQFIEEIPIAAPPAAVWKALLDVGAWFRFDDVPNFPAMKLDPRVGGMLTSATADGSVQMFSGIVGHIEREKLLRITGPMGMTHLPMMNAMIWELQPSADGKSTTLRFCQRAFGYGTADLKKNFRGGWKQLWPQLKALAEQSAGAGKAASRNGTSVAAGRRPNRRRVTA